MLATICLKIDLKDVLLPSYCYTDNNKFYLTIRNDIRQKLRYYISRSLSDKTTLRNFVNLSGQYVDLSDKLCRLFRY